MNKKGEEESQDLWLTLFYVLFAFACVGFIFGWGNSIINHNDFEKSYLAKDLSYLIDVLYFVPGDVNFEYNQHDINLMKYIYTFEDKVSVKGATAEYGVAPRHYPYAKSKTILAIPEEVVTPYNIYFGKSGKTVFLGKQIEESKLIECPSTDIGELSIIIDPGHGSSKGYADKQDTGFIGLYNEEDLTSEIARIMVNQFKAESTRPIDTNRYMELKDRIEKAKGKIVVSIHIGQSNDLIAYYHAGDIKSMAIACNILNQIETKVPGFDSIQLYPLTMLSEDDPKNIIQDSGVFLEIGSVDDDFVHKNQVKIGGAIWEGIH